MIEIELNKELNFLDPDAESILENFNSESAQEKLSLITNSISLLLTAFINDEMEIDYDESAINNEFVKGFEEAIEKLDLSDAESAFLIIYFMMLSFNFANDIKTAMSNMFKKSKFDSNDILDFIQLNHAQIPKILAWAAIDIMNMILEKNKGEDNAGET
jgi:hypothetical protein